MQAVLHCYDPLMSLNMFADFLVFIFTSKLLSSL